MGDLRKVAVVTNHEPAKSKGKRSGKTSGDLNHSQVLKGVRVLVVDDEADTRDLGKAVLSNHGGGLRQHRQRKQR